jgi:hypothetical protein
MKRNLVLEDDSLAMRDLRDVLERTLIETAAALEALLSFIDEGHQIDVLVADRGTRNVLPIRSGHHVAISSKAVRELVGRDRLNGDHCVNEKRSPIR